MLQRRGFPARLMELRALLKGWQLCSRGWPAQCTGQTCSSRRRLQRLRQKCPGWCCLGPGSQQRLGLL